MRWAWWKCRAWPGCTQTVCTLMMQAPPLGDGACLPWVPIPGAHRWQRLQHIVIRCLKARLLSLQAACAPLQRDALQFEWAWQHPTVSIAVREMALALPKRALSGVKGKARQCSASSPQPTCADPTCMHIYTQHFMLAACPEIFMCDLHWLC